MPRARCSRATASPEPLPPSSSRLHGSARGRSSSRPRTTSCSRWSSATSDASSPASGARAGRDTSSRTISIASCARCARSPTSCPPCTSGQRCPSASPRHGGASVRQTNGWSRRASARGAERHRGPALLTSCGIRTAGRPVAEELVRTPREAGWMDVVRRRWTDVAGELELQLGLVRLDRHSADVARPTAAPATPGTVRFALRQTPLGRPSARCGKHSGEHRPGVPGRGRAAPRGVQGDQVAAGRSAAGAAGLIGTLLMLAGDVRLLSARWRAGTPWSEDRWHSS